MVSSSFVEQPGMKLELPTIKSKQVARIENLVIYISKDDQVYLQNQKVELETLGEAIKKQIPNLEEKTLVLKADKEAEHGIVVQIMDIAKQSGLKKIVIGTRIEGEG